MKENSRVAAKVRELFRKQRFAILATCQNDGQPYGSLVAFSCTDDLHDLLFVTRRDTRKFANILADPRVALVVDDRANLETDLQLSMAVTAVGSAVDLQNEEREKMTALFLDEHPSMRDFALSPDCALLKVNVQTYYVVSQFQQVTELQVQNLYFE